MHKKGFAIEAGNWLLIFQTLCCKTDYNQKHTFFDSIETNRSVAIKPSTKGLSIFAQSVLNCDAAQKLKEEYCYVRLLRKGGFVTLS